MDTLKKPPSPPRGFNIDAPAFEPRADAQVEGLGGLGVWWGWEVCFGTERHLIFFPFRGGKGGRNGHTGGRAGAGWLVVFFHSFSPDFLSSWFLYDFFF